MKQPVKIKYWWDEVKLGIRNVFRKNSAKKIMAAATGLLIVIFILALLYHNWGLFVISVEPDLQMEGFAIAETEDFESPRVKLFGDALEECNNITFNSIPEDVDNYEGEHNGENYVAYTFFLKNGGQHNMDYRYELVIDEVSKGVDEAAWIMLFVNGEARIFAKGREDKTPERMYNYTGYPFLDKVGKEKQVNMLSDSYKGYITDKDLEQYKYLESDGLYELATIPFESDKRVVTGDREELEPGEIDKFTIVLWLEGNDPECVDAIKGGVLGLGMKFTKTND